ncbi:MAG: hypothetical protein CSA50_05380 [Gammaproteobacteria bacterium]|nr:MAG: hypothetical protein CSA50_05380 [Gammaproteobacteria bacterium]
MRLTEKQFKQLQEGGYPGGHNENQTIRQKLGLLPFPDDAFTFRNTPHSKALHYLLKKPSDYQSQAEHWHQCYIFHYFEMYYPEVYEYLYATPNAGARGKVERGRLLSAGLKAGFPDISLDLPMNGYHGLRCELKRPDRRAVVSDKQSHWISLLNGKGYFAFIAYGHEDVINQIKTYCSL